MIRRVAFEEGLNELNTLLLDMGDRVERAIEAAMRALQAVDGEAARNVIANDAELNRLEERIVELGTRLIATQQPVAKDLRRILVAFRISNDLERMGDLAVDIAKAVLRLEGREWIKPLVDLPKMAEIVQTMTRESIRSFLHENVDLACKMARDDDTVDAIYGSVLQELFALRPANARDSSQAMLLSFVGRYLERIADHATNIGESVVYLVTNKRPDLNR
jgi:phosphate transport system protein